MEHSPVCLDDETPVAAGVGRYVQKKAGRAAGGYDQPAPEGTRLVLAAGMGPKDSGTAAKFDQCEAIFADRVGCEAGRDTLDEVGIVDRSRRGIGPAQPAGRRVAGGPVEGEEGEEVGNLGLVNLFVSTQLGTELAGSSASWGRQSVLEHDGEVVQRFSPLRDRHGPLLGRLVDGQVHELQR